MSYESTISVLLVEDDPDDAAETVRALESAGDYRVEHCTTLADTIALMSDTSRPQPSVVLLDLNLPDSEDVETYDRLEALGPPPVVVITGVDDPVRAHQLIERGAQDYLVKGEMTDSALARSLRQAVGRGRLQEELEEARDRALVAARSQSAFVAAMSHEIRTPLNAILGMSDLLARTRLDSEQREYVEIFRRCGRALKGLLDNALELSRLEVGELKLKDEPFDLEGLLDECLEALAYSAHTKGLALVSEVDDSAAGEARGDATRLRQVLMNLLGNAVKFTEQGRILLRARTGASGLEIEVEDTGTGIPAERHEAVFERFVQAGDDTARQFGGSGLGLALSKDLVEAMGGRISLESEEGQGSCFRIELPLTVTPRSRSRFDGQRVLVVLADPVERESLGRQLGGRGARVDFAESVASGEAALREGSFSALLLDARLPGGGGIGLLHSPDMPSPATTRRIVLLPMDHRVGDLSRFEDLHATALCKPLRWTELEPVLRGEAVRHATGRSQTEPPRLSEARILLAEDAPDNRTVALAHLSATGCEVDVAVNGREAVARFEAGGYDLVLMDVHMPEVDGCEATRRIRAREISRGAARTPIIALTADAMPEQRAAVLEAGCDAHLAKPFDREDLFRVLRRYLRDTEERRPLQSRSRPKAVALKASEVYDIPPELEDLAEDYLGRRRIDAESLREAVRKGDFEESRRLGHNMKGSGGGYGFAHISQLGAAIQHASEAGDADEVRRLADELEEYASKVLDALASF